MAMPPSRLQIVTGKGGVGKTTFALALTKKLQNQGLKSAYTSFELPANEKFCKDLAIDFINLKIPDSVEEYIAKKLNSKIAAKWICKTPFFNSLVEMLPGLTSLILLGHILDLLEKDPDLYIVIDSPASGHTITLFESTHNFKKIFKEGPLVKDINKMHTMLNDSNFTKLSILAIPTEMGIQEAKELKDELSKLSVPAPSIYINDSYSKMANTKSFDLEKLPSFLKQKIENEQSILSNLKLPIIEHLLEQDDKKFVLEFLENLKELKI